MNSPANMIKTTDTPTRPIKQQLKRITLTCLTLACTLTAQVSAWQSGDTVSINEKLYVLRSDNLINNPGFEEGFTGWTDATSSAATLTSSKFTIHTTGGVNNSQYLVGNNNEDSKSSGSIGTGWSITSGKTYVLAYYAKYQSTTTAGSEEFSKISLTNYKTSNLEPKIVVNATKIDAGNQWTLNTVGFTNSNPAYSYVVARFRWLGGRLGFDQFALHEAFEMPDIVGLQALITEAQTLYADTTQGAAIFLAAITEAQSFLTSESSADVTKAKTTLSQAITAFKLLNASSSQPVDLTARLNNPGFDDNNATGWSGAGTVGYHSVEFYQKTFNMYQTLAGLPAGKYRLQVRGFERPKNNDGGAAYRAGTETIYATFYAKASSFPERNTAFPSLYKHRFTGTGQLNNYVNTMAGAEIMFNNPDSAYYVTTLTDIYLTDGATLTVGAKSDFQQGGYWALFDDFKLYYEGQDYSGAATMVLALVNQAKVLAASHIQTSAFTTLSNAIATGEQAAGADSLILKDLAIASQALTAAIETGKTSEAAYTALQSALTAAQAALGEGIGADSLQAAISRGQATYNNLEADLNSLATAATDLSKAVLAYRLANATGTTPTVTTTRQYARGSSVAFLRGSFTGTGITERGICWSTHPEPTVLDGRSTTRFGSAGYLFKVDGLQPSTVYYMRAYALTSTYAVGYGDVIKVITIPRGTTRYTMASGFPDADYTRVNAAMKSAVEYYNTYTSIKNLSLSVNYGSGTPTAEASYGGWMRFGPSSSYQQTGTALHEMAHTIGVGTHWYWYNGTTALKAGGKWLGERATAVLNFMDGTSSAQISGDNTHGWPYGINGAHEDNGTDWLYTVNSLLMQGFGEDGLPTPTGKFTTPAYTFEHTDSVKYYLKSEDSRAGRDTAFVLENNGSLSLRTMTAAQAAANDSAAWYLTFNPVNCYYTLRNVATGKLLTYMSTGINGIRLVERQTPAISNYFQFMGARINAQVGTDGKKVTKKGYYIIYPSATENPYTLTTSTSKTFMASTFDISNTATLQRWLVLSADDLKNIDGSFTSTPTSPHASSVVAYTENGQLMLTNLPPSSSVNVHNLLGMVQSTATPSGSNYSVSLPQGVYMVTVQAGTHRETIKVLVN
jgi:hypothetical protein